jgi:hypothetical protein
LGVIFEWISHIQQPHFLAVELTRLLLLVYLFLKVSSGQRYSTEEFNPSFRLNQRKDVDFHLKEDKAKKDKGKIEKDKASSSKQKGKGKELVVIPEANEVSTIPLQNIVDCAPCYEMVGESGRFVNAHYKPR